MESPKNPFQPQEFTPEKLGKYVVERELGRGGMGVVYLCRDPDLDRLVAVKVLPESVQSDPERLRRFRDEAKNLAKLHHPNIAAIYAIERMDGGAWLLVMEYVEGENLARTLKVRRLDPAESLKVCVQVARAIAAAHAAGIWHRDIKPGNIMITSEQKVKVLDFGLAKRERGLASSGDSPDEDVTATFATNPGQIIGTPGYMSPEQIYGKGVDHRTDIFSFGSVLYVCLTGEHAFAGETTMHVITNTCHVDPDWDRMPPPPEVPLRLHELVRQCLAKDKADRLDDINVAVAELEAAMAEFSSMAGSFGGGAGVGGIVSAGGDGEAYEVLKDLSVGVARVQRVRRTIGGAFAAAAGRALCRKIIQPDPLLMGPEQAAAMCREFVERARVQQRAAEADPASWAPMHDYGGPGRSASDPDSRFGSAGGVGPMAFYITNEYESSLAKVAGVEPTHRVLHRIVSEVVGALLAMKHSLGREHGRLTPPNVLLTDENLARASVVLTDPAAAAADVRGEGSPATSGRGSPQPRDMADLGRIIYQLVTQQKPPERRLVSIEDSPKWRALGRAGGRWRDLCERLLDPGQRVTLEEVQKELEAMGGGITLPPVNRRLVKTLAGAAVVMLLVVAGAIAFRAYNGGPKPGPTPAPDPAPIVHAVERYRTAHWNWVHEITTLQGGRDFLTMVEESPLLLGMVDDVLDLRKSGALPDPASITESAAEGASALLTPFEEKVIALVQELKDAAAGVEPHGWLAIEEFLGPGRHIERLFAAERVNAEERGGFLEAFAALMRNHALLPEIGQAARLWQRIEIHHQDIAEASRGDRVLAQLLSVASRRVASAGDVPSLIAQLGQVEQAARVLFNAINSRWSRIDVEHFRNSWDRYHAFDPETADLEVFRMFAEEIRKGAYDPLGPERNPIALLYRHFDEIGRNLEIGRRADECLVDERLEERYRAVQEALAAFDPDATWDGFRSTETQFAQLAGALSSEMKELGHDVTVWVRQCGEECRLELEGVLGTTIADALLQLDDQPVTGARHLPLASAFEDVWNAERARIRDAADAEARDCAWAGHAAEVKSALTSFAAVFREPVALPENWRHEPDVDDVLREMARERIDEILGEAVEPLARYLSADDLDFDAVALQRAAIAQRYEDWRRETAAALHDVASNVEFFSTRLDQAYGLDEAAPDDERTMHGVRQLAQANTVHQRLRNHGVEAVTHIDERIEALERIQGKDRAALVAIVRDPDDARERRVAAWRELGRDDHIQDGRVLSDEQDAWPVLERLFMQLPEARRSVLQRELDAEKPRRWVAHVERAHAPDEDWFVTVADLISTFGVGPHHLTELSGHSQFSFRLHELKALSKDADIDALEQAVDGLLEWLSPPDIDPLTPDGTSFLGELASLLDALREADPEAIAKAMDWKDVGPGAIGWHPLPGANNEYVIYCPPDWECRKESTGDYTIVRAPDTKWPNSMPLVFRDVGHHSAGGGVGGSTYLQTTEVSVGTVADIVNNLPELDREGFLELLDSVGVSRAGMGPPQVRDVRAGPRLWDWQWQQSTMNLRDQWLEHERPERETVPARVLTDVDGREVTLDPTYIGPYPEIDAGHPMQHISIAAAIHVGRLLNCRLPLVTEWKSAAAQVDDSQPKPNLRDATWEQHRRFWDDTRRMEVRVPGRTQPLLLNISKNGDPGGYVKEYPGGGPSEGAFGRPGRLGIVKNHDGSDYSDEYLWFRRVYSNQQEPEREFRDLAGNVWEFVLSDDAPENLRRPSEETIEHRERFPEMLTAQMQYVRVIGGSALSDPDLGRDTAHHLESHWPRGPGSAVRPEMYTFADVGLRLAFSANVGPRFEANLRDLIAKQPYLLRPD